MATPNNAPITSATPAIRPVLSAFMYNSPFFNTTQSYSDRFGDISVSSKSTGNTVNLVKPARIKVEGGRGQTSGAFDPKPVVEETVALTIDSYRRAHAFLDTSKQATDYDKSPDGQILNPWSENLSEFACSDFLEEVNNVSEAVLAPSTGVDFDTAMDAISLIKENGINGKDIFMLAPYRIHSSMVKNNIELQNPSKAISEQWYKGIMADGAGARWLVDEHTPIHTNGTATDGAFDSAAGLTPLGTVTATVANGATTLAVEGIGTDGTITAGTIIYIDNTLAVNNITRSSQGRKKGFVVVSDATSVAGAVTLTVREAFVDGSGTTKDESLQNVTLLPTTGAVVSFIGEVGASYKQGIAYVKDTFGYATVNLTKPEGGQKYSQDTLMGVKMRMIFDYDKDEDANAYRIDSFSGYVTPRGEWGVRVMEKVA
jgi:hypothetical protein